MIVGLGLGGSGQDIDTTLTVELLLNILQVPISTQLYPVFPKGVMLIQGLLDLYMAVEHVAPTESQLEKCVNVCLVRH